MIDLDNLERIARAAKEEKDTPIRKDATCIVYPAIMEFDETFNIDTVVALFDELKSLNAEKRHLENNLDVQRVGRKRAEAHLKTTLTALAACERIGRDHPILGPGIKATAASVRDALEEVG